MPRQEQIDGANNLVVSLKRPSNSDCQQSSRGAPRGAFLVEKKGACAP